MKLIKKLGTRLSKTDRLESWAIFWCDGCSKEIERPLGNGLKAKSCGCIKYKLISESNKGKTSWNKGIKGFNSGKNNPMYGKKQTKETRQKISEKNTGKLLSRNNPNFGKRDADHPAYGYKHSEEVRQILSEKAKERLKNLENNPFYGKKHSEDTKVKMRLASIGKKKSEEHRIKNSISHIGLQIGENNGMYGVHRFGEESPNWQDGKSFEEYPPEFFDTRESILERDNYQCQYPNCTHTSNILDCHHIDYDKKNNSPENLITLCRKCHTKTNGKNKRKYYTEFYQNIMIKKLIDILA